jgi:hypothetical protein
MTLNEIKRRIYIETGKVALQLIKEETTDLSKLKTKVIDLNKLRDLILETIDDLSKTDDLDLSQLSFHKERMVTLQRDVNQMLKIRPINRWDLELIEFEFADRVNELSIDEVDLAEDKALLGAVIDVAGFMFSETVKSLTTTLNKFELCLITSIAKSVIEDKVEEIDITPQLETISERIEQVTKEELDKCELPFGELNLVQLEDDVLSKAKQSLGSGSNHFDCIKVRQRIATFETIKTLSKCKTTNLKDYTLLGYEATHLFEWLGKSPADYIKPEARLIDFYDEALLDVFVVIDVQHLNQALNEDCSFYLQANCFFLKKKNSKNPNPVIPINP